MIDSVYKTYFAPGFSWRKICQNNVEIITYESVNIRGSGGLRLHCLCLFLNRETLEILSFAQRQFGWDILLQWFCIACNGIKILHKKIEFVATYDVYYNVIGE